MRRTTFVRLPITTGLWSNNNETSRYYCIFLPGQLPRRSRDSSDKPSPSVGFSRCQHFCAGKPRRVSPASLGPASRPLGRAWAPVSGGAWSSWRATWTPAGGGGRGSRGWRTGRDWRPPGSQRQGRRTSEGAVAPSKGGLLYWIWLI